MKSGRVDILIRFLLIFLAALVIVPIVVFFVPLTSCPNCTGDMGDEGTTGTYINGKEYATGCRSCDDRRMTLYQRWTYRPFH